jgi:hypothetical protein
LIAIVFIYRRHVTMSLLLPEQVNSVLSSFAAFYQTKMAKRRISWDPTLSSVILEYLGSSHCHNQGMIHIE